MSLNLMESTYCLQSLIEVINSLDMATTLSRHTIDRESLEEVKTYTASHALTLLHLIEQEINETTDEAQQTLLKQNMGLVLANPLVCERLLTLYNNSNLHPYYHFIDTETVCIQYILYRRDLLQIRQVPQNIIDHFYSDSDLQDKSFATIIQEIKMKRDALSFDHDHDQDARSITDIELRNVKALYFVIEALKKPADECISLKAKCALFLNELIVDPRINSQRIKKCMRVLFTKLSEANNSSEIYVCVLACKEYISLQQEFFNNTLNAKINNTIRELESLLLIIKQIILSSPAVDRVKACFNYILSSIETMNVSGYEKDSIEFLRRSLYLPLRENKLSLLGAFDLIKTLVRANRESPHIEIVLISMRKIFTNCFTLFKNIIPDDIKLKFYDFILFLIQHHCVNKIDRLHLQQKLTSRRIQTNREQLESRILAANNLAMLPILLDSAIVDIQNRTEFGNFTLNPQINSYATVLETLKKSILNHELINYLTDIPSDGIERLLLTCTNLDYVKQFGLYYFNDANIRTFIGNYITFLLPRCSTNRVAERLKLIKDEIAILDVDEIVPILQNLASELLNLNEYFNVTLAFKINYWYHQIISLSEAINVCLRPTLPIIRNAHLSSEASELFDQYYQPEKLKKHPAVRTFLYKLNTTLTKQSIDSLVLEANDILTDYLKTNDFSNVITHTLIPLSITNTASFSGDKFTNTRLVPQTASIAELNHTHNSVNGGYNAGQ